ncbi:SH3 domain-containing protein [Ruegeria aquimaris]|uniref:SH3 domain-containing protein n=1 Tax=Ruegeria aquimaris TaxID=2984333 RepID=A0ABT3AN38_9RHOB|nr:SH3 domain-containing protein [Ruegeria sp. XHP0148]MCV2890059.1 SH3 domain-containing protein [Ruegeria sp. XHP0148]
MRLVLICALLLSAAPTLAGRQSFPPQDEAARDPSLVAFRDALRAAVARREIEALTAAACPDLMLSDNGPGGPEELRQFLNDPNADVEARWQVLAETLDAPGYFDDDGEFWMPYHWRIHLPARIDAALSYFTNGENVNLRAAPDREAPVVARVSFEVVLTEAADAYRDYQAVILTDGTQGYLHRDFLVQMSGYRAAFAVSPEGAWQLCTFTTGR